MSNKRTQNEVNEFLDELRESGVTNMFGATPFIVDEFDVTNAEARKYLVTWMETFHIRHPKIDQDLREQLGMEEE